MTKTTATEPAVPNVRIFRGYETRQIDSSGHPADHEKWYYEPSDYEGDVLWSRGYGSRAEAYHAAGCSAE
jgi:hypothetical protein